MYMLMLTEEKVKSRIQPKFSMHVCFREKTRYGLIMNFKWMKSRLVANFIISIFVLSGLTVPDIPPAKRKLDLSQFFVKHEERQRE